MSITLTTTASGSMYTNTYMCTVIKWHGMIAGGHKKVHSNHQLVIQLGKEALTKRKNSAQRWPNSKSACSCPHMMYTPTCWLQPVLLHDPQVWNESVLTFCLTVWCKGPWRVQFQSPEGSCSCEINWWLASKSACSCLYRMCTHLLVSASMVTYIPMAP